MFYIMSYYRKISYTVSSNTVLTKTEYFLTPPSPICLLRGRGGGYLSTAQGPLISTVADFQLPSRILLSFTEE